MEIIKRPADTPVELFKFNSETFTASDACFDKFRQQILSNQQTVYDTAIEIYAALPNMPTRNIEFVMESISYVSDKLWYLRALCIAELLQRREPLAGGRSRRAAPGEGRKEFIKAWAAQLGIGTTKLQQDLKIVDVFSKRYMYDKESGKVGRLEDAPIRQSLILSEESQKAAEEQHPNFSQTIKLNDGGEYIEAVAFTDKDGKPLYLAQFTPHKDLSRELYVVMSQIGNPETARQIEAKLIEIAESGEPIPTAVSLRRQILKNPELEKEPGFFEIRCAGAWSQAYIKFTMPPDDSKLFKRAAELAFEIEDFPLGNLNHQELFSLSGDGYKLMVKALQAYVILLKSQYKKDWTIERTLNPENFTFEVSEEKRKRRHAYSKLTKKAQREKKRLAEQLEKLEGGGIDKESAAWKNYEKQLDKFHRLEQAAVSAYDEYISVTVKNLNSTPEQQEEEKTRLLQKYRKVEGLTENKPPDVPPATTKKTKKK
jgi:hypothetical protein